MILLAHLSVKNTACGSSDKFSVQYMKKYDELEVFNLMLENQATIMRGLALILDSRNIALYTAAQEMRSRARINEGVVAGLRSSSNTAESDSADL